MPAVPLTFAQQAGFLPGTPANSNFDPGNRCRSGPCHTANRQLALLDFAVGLRLGNQTPDSLQRYRLSHELFPALPLEEVRSGLVVTAEWLADHINLCQPFDGGHGIPPGNDETQRISMLDRKRLSIHSIGKQPFTPTSVVHAQATLETNWFVTQIKFASVGASKPYLFPPRLNSCPVQNLRERHPRPLGCANSS